MVCRPLVVAMRRLVFVFDRIFSDLRGSIVLQSRLFLFACSAAAIGNLACRFVFLRRSFFCWRQQYRYCVLATRLTATATTRAFTMTDGSFFFRLILCARAFRTGCILRIADCRNGFMARFALAVPRRIPGLVIPGLSAGRPLMRLFCRALLGVFQGVYPYSAARTKRTQAGRFNFYVAINVAVVLSFTKGALPE